MSFEQDGITQYTVDELKGILRDGQMQVVDVRTEEEYESGHIAGIPSRPMQEVMDWMNELNPEASYVFVCRSGARSQKVAKFLQENGFSHVANYSGGMLAWDDDVSQE
jgi:rhodanese-related sulfurtransferase